MDTSLEETTDLLMTTDGGEELGLKVFCRKYVHVHPCALYKDRDSLSQCILVTALR